MIFGHVDHVGDVLDLFVHVDGHGGDNFFEILGSLLVVLFHEVILFEESFRDGFEFGHFGLYLISLMPELFVLLFEMIDKGHEVLDIQIETDAVAVLIGGLIVGRYLRDWVRNGVHERLLVCETVSPCALGVKLEVIIGRNCGQTMMDELSDLNCYKSKLLNNHCITNN